MENNNQEYIHNKCPNCGSDLQYLPGTSRIKCISCDSQFNIESLGHGKLDSEETDYEATIEKIKKENTKITIERTIHCEACGGLITLGNKTVSTACPFCGSSRVIEENKQEEIISINGVIPFKIPEDEVKAYFKKWISKKSLAPRAFKKSIISPSYSAFYIPFYTFDSETSTHYTAERGDYYYVTVTRNGKSVREKRTKWTRVSGWVNKDFDDIIIRGTSNALNKNIDKIKNYDFRDMEKYQEKYLLGYYAERASVPLSEGFNCAKKEMMSEIKRKCIDNIGGDTYKNLNMRTDFNDVTFKQIMAPIYNGQYVYRKKNYKFVANGQTGKFDGKAPVSPVKVSILVFILLAVVLGIFVLAYFDYIGRI